MSIIREIVFKKGEDKAAQRCLEILDKAQKVLATNTIEGKRTIVARFEDVLDYLAFLHTIGAVTVKVDPAAEN